MTQIDASLVVGKGEKFTDTLTASVPKKLAGVSAKVSTADPWYTLGSVVNVIVSLSVSEYVHVDSISYRVSFYVTATKWIRIILIALCHNLLHSLFYIPE